MPSPIDITGQRFGRLIAIRVEGTKPRRWLCQCDCGTNVVVTTESLTLGNTKSCGCLKLDLFKDRNRQKMKDMAGQRFGRLIALRPYDQQTEGRWRWQCRCDCGKEIIVTQGSLNDGHTRSCGCLYLGNKSGLKHGHASTGAATPTYISWSMMRRRCTDPNATGYENYGGRGIKVCERWNSFENFLADMGERPPGRTIDRYPNQDGDYEPNNCRWATHSQQQLNRRRH